MDATALLKALAAINSCDGLTGGYAALSYRMESMWMRCAMPHRRLELVHGFVVLQGDGLLRPLVQRELDNDVGNAHQ